MTTLATTRSTSSTRPSVGRRIAVVAAGVPACALPLDVDHQHRR